MPSSFHGHISDVLGIYLKKNPQKVLDVGIGFGKWGTLFREYGDIFRGRYSKTEWKVRITGLEIFDKYRNPIYNYVYDEVFYGSVQDFLLSRKEDFDFIYAGDVIEHLDKETALNVINRLIERSKTFVLSIPLSDRWPQGEILGNKHEAHLSIWEEKDFENCSRKFIYQNSAGKPLGLFVWEK